MGLMSLWTLWYRFMLYSVILTVIRIIIRSLLTHARTITQNTFKPLDFALNMAWEDCFSCPFDIICKDFTNVKIAVPMVTLLFIQLSASNENVRLTACIISLLIRCLYLVLMLHFIVIGQEHNISSLLLRRNMSSHYLLSRH